MQLCLIRENSLPRLSPNLFAATPVENARVRQSIPYIYAQSAYWLKHKCGIGAPAKTKYAKTKRADLHRKKATGTSRYLQVGVHVFVK